MPTSPREFKTIMENLPSDLSGFTFVDFGSGKGRVVLLASRYNFREIVGVEYSEQLHEVAERNIEKFQDLDSRCAEISCTRIDASEYELPEGPSVLYLYHPFDEAITSAVVERIRSSYESNPRKLYIVYYYPVFSKLFRELDFLEPVAVRKRPFSRTFGLEIYQSK